MTEADIECPGGVLHHSEVLARLRAAYSFVRSNQEPSSGLQKRGQRFLEACPLARHVLSRSDIGMLALSGTPAQRLAPTF